MSRFTKSGNSRPHVVHNVYQNTSRYSSQWEWEQSRSAWRGRLLIALMSIGVVILAVLLP